MVYYCRITLFLFFALMTVSEHAEACTGIKLVAKDNSFVHGRTLEFGVMVDTSILVIPRGYEFIGTTPEGPGLSYKAKYGALGAMAADDTLILDGINEKGLAIGVFYFPGYAEYAKITSTNKSRALSPVDFSNWIITQFATVEEVKEAVAKVSIAPTIIKEWGNDVPPPFHYIVFDKTGKSIVIEPIKGSLIVYDNPIGTMSNSPAFDWHMTNLRNFINLTPFNVSPLKVRGIELAPFGQGSGMVGLPGDFTPPSRFVRASIFSITATPSDKAEQAVGQAFHILNQFDIPVGTVRQKEKGITYSDATLVTAVRDPQSLKYYFKTYDDQTIRVVDLKKFDLNGKALLRASTASKQPIVDFTADLK